MNLSKKVIVTESGRYFDYTDINKDNIFIDDIISSLSKLNRFVGHSIRPYSVGEHSLLCYEMARLKGYSVREQLLVLIHDFAEAYVGDCPAPLKDLLPDFETIEDKVDEAIFEHLGIAPPTKEEYIKVKNVDITMLLFEMKNLTYHNYKEYTPSDGIEIYHEFLDYNFNVFNLSSNAFRFYSHYDKAVTEIMKEVFENLMKLYKEDEANV